MTKLASPGYKHSTLVNQVLAPAAERTIEFKGLNRLPVITDGEMSDMKDLTSDNYPLLTPRKLRGTYELPEDIKRPVRLFKRYGKLGIIAIIEEPVPDTEYTEENASESEEAQTQTREVVTVYYNGEEIESARGKISSNTRAVAINTKICFFPEKKYVDIVKTAQGIQPGDFGSLEASIDNISVTVTISNKDARLPLTSGHGFKADDAVTFTGTLTYGNTTVSFNTSAVISSVTDDHKLVFPTELFINMIGEGVSSATYAGKIERKLPADLDHVIEWNNRLWGVNNADNTIYACKLGDPTNWNYFQGTSLDSYYAQQGTDEAFTGAAVYSGHLIYFKPSSMTRIYGTAPGNFQVTNSECYGVEDGSRDSVLTINDTVFYKSSVGIMAYQGGVPYCISDKLNSNFRYVVAGTEGRKYYASFPENGENVIMVFDIAKGYWHKESGKRYYDTCTLDNRMYYTTNGGEYTVCGLTQWCSEELFVDTEARVEELMIVNPETPSEKYTDLTWYAVFGPFDEYIEEHKIYSKLALRLIFKEIVSSADIYIKVARFGNLDSEEWEKVGHYGMTGENWEDMPSYILDELAKWHDADGDFIPIVPRRCDRYWIKIEGRGNCQIKSLTRRVRQGTFGRI